MKKLFALTMAVFMVLGSALTGVSAKGGPKVYEAPEVVYEEVCYVEDSYEVDLWAGQDILAGSVVVTIENGMLSVEVITDFEYDDIHIGTYNELPTKRPAPGQMVFNEGEYLVGDTVIVIVHVAFSDVIGSPVAGETAYGGNNQTGANAWFYYIPLEIIECEQPPVNPGVWTQETAYAYFGQNSIEFNPNGGAWGWYAEYQEGTFDVYAGAGLNDLSKGTFVGTITVENGTAVFTAVDETVRVLEEHFYIGELIPERIPGQWQTIDMSNPVYMTFHLSVEILVEE